MTPRRPDSGVILVNVLVTLALGAALVTLMLTAQDADLDRARRAGALAQAEAIAIGAEASVVVALARDMIEAPETDHLAEPWAAVAQETVALGPGQFSVRITDLRGRFDVNGLAGGSLVARQGLLRLVTVLGLPPDTAATLMGAVAQRGQLESLDDVPGLEPGAAAVLAPHVVFLDGDGSATGGPGGTTDGGVNLNAAGPEVLTAVLGSAAVAARLLAVRERAGFLTPGDLSDVGIVAVAGAGFTSDRWEAEITVEVDGVTLRLVSRVRRLVGAGRAEVVVVSRRFGPEGGVLPPVPEAAPTL